MIAGKAPTTKSGLDRLTGSAAARRWMLALVIVGSTLAAYHNALRAPFVFDDRLAIMENRTIRQLWPLSDALHPPADGAGVTGRPLVNLSLALNYAWGGFDVRGYHAFNLVLHVLAALALWGVLRRTLRSDCSPRAANSGSPAVAAEDDRARAEWTAFCTALLWAVHPLQTESVVCVVQRNEVMAGLFYLTTLYGFIRSVTVSASKQHPARRRWQTVAVVSCLLGMASKEVVATAPLLVLLYDRTFVAGGFREAWRERRAFYLALASTWLLLAWLMAENPQRSGMVGLGLGVSSWDYLLTQCGALVTYVKLTFWPHPLVLDYGTGVVKDWREVWWQGLLVVTFLLATVWALWRRPKLGLVGACFFAILAPSSSFVPLISQTIAEHRMYLPLAAIIVLIVAGTFRRWEKGAPIFASVCAVALGGVTVQRNATYANELELWRDTVAKRPNNARAHNNLAVVLLENGQRPDAFAQLDEALRLQPDYADALRNLSQALLQTGRGPEALARAEEAQRIEPASATGAITLGNALRHAGNIPGAISTYRAATELAPDNADAHAQLGEALRQAGDLESARAQLALALRLQPGFATAHEHLGQVLLDEGRIGDAVIELKEAVRLQPGLSATHQKLAGALLQLGRTAEALDHDREAVRLTPESFEAHYNLGTDLAALGRLEEAITELGEARRLRPESIDARFNRANTLFRVGRLTEAIAEYQGIILLQPGLADAHLSLGHALMWAERPAEAIASFQTVLGLAPPTPATLGALGRALTLTGRRREAAAAYQEALRLDPSYAPAQDALDKLGR